MIALIDPWWSDSAHRFVMAHVEDGAAGLNR